MSYTEEEMISAKQRSFEDGSKHAKPSAETLRLITEQRTYFKELIDAHEDRELKKYDELLDLFQKNINIFQQHIDETADLNKTFSSLLSGSKFLKALFSGLVGMVIGIGIIVTAIVKFIEWLRHG